MAKIITGLNTPTLRKMLKDRNTTRATRCLAYAVLLKRKQKQKR